MRVSCVSCVALTVATADSVLEICWRTALSSECSESSILDAQESKSDRKAARREAASDLKGPPLAWGSEAPSSRGVPEEGAIVEGAVERVGQSVLPVSSSWDGGIDVDVWGGLGFAGRAPRCHPVRPGRAWFRWSSAEQVSLDRALLEVCGVGVVLVTGRHTCRRCS